MERNRVLLSLFGIISLSSIGSSMVIFPGGGHISSYRPRWPTKHFGGFHGGWHQKFFPTYGRHYRFSDMFHPIQFQHDYHRSYSIHRPSYHRGYTSIRRTQPYRRFRMPIISQRPSFFGSRISSFPRRIRIPLHGSPIIDGWSRITGPGAGSQGILQGLATVRRGVDTPSFPVVSSGPINVPHALVAWVGGDDDETTKISIQQQLGTISGAGALGLKPFETVAGATKVQPIGKAGVQKVGTGDISKIAKTVSGVVSGKGVDAVGVGKKGIIHDGKKIVSKKGIHPIHPKVKGGIGKGAIVGGGAKIIGGGAKIIGGGAKIVGGGAIVGGAGAAVVGQSVVQKSVSVAKVGGVSGAKISDGLDKVVDGKAAVGDAKIKLKINDADSVKINIGTDAGKLVKGEKSGDTVIKGKITTVVEPVATNVVAVKAVETVATKLVDAKASAVVGAATGAVKDKIILPKKGVIVPDQKIIAAPVAVDAIGPKILPGKPLLEKVIPVKKDLVPHKAPIVKL